MKTIANTAKSKYQSGAHIAAGRALKPICDKLKPTPLDFWLYLVMDQGRFGAHAEYLFAVKCMERGYDVSMPLKHTSIYDMIIDTGDRLIKVQVKASAQPPREQQKSVNVMIYKSNNQMYKVGEIDFIALYVHEFQGFFIFKYDQPKKSYRVHPEGKYKKHFNNFAFDL